MPAPAASSRHLYTGHRQGSTQATPPAEGTPSRRAFVPGVRRSPGFDAIVPPIDASAVVHTRSSSRRPPDPLTAGLLPQRSPPPLLTGAACGGLGSPPALANPEGQTSITGTARFAPATFYIASLPFQDTPPNGGSARVLFCTAQVRVLADGPGGPGYQRLSRRADNPLRLLAKEAIHHPSASCDHRTQLVPVHGLGGADV